jgi:arylsulfatase A-like enzyme
VSSDLTRRDLIRAGGVGAAGIALFGASACDSGGDTGEARTTAQAPANAMNVVVVVMDSLRSDHVYGPRARTDAINKVMQAGVRFTNAYPEGMPTIPARRAIMAGRRTYPFRGWKPKWDDLPPQPGWEPVGSDGEMWTEVLRRHGWTTGYVTDNPHLLLPVHKRFRRRFDRVELVDGQVPVRRKPTRRVSQKEVNRHLPPSMRDGRAEPRMAAYLAVNPRDRREEDFNAAKVFRESMGWIEWASARQPFALVIDSFDAHEPWDAPRRLVDLYGPPRADGVEPIQPFATPAGQWRDLGLDGGILHRMRQLYAAEVTLVDVWLGKFLDRLAALGLEQNTMLVLVSDHGVLLGEYGWLGKRYSEMHQALTHVPLVLRHPAGKAQGAASSYYASTHDIGPTVLAAAGIEVPGHMDGVDLSPVFDGKAPAEKRGYRTSAYNTYVSAGDDRWLLIAGNRRQELRLYDRKADPGETRNVARQHPQQVRRLWNLILRDAGPKGLPRFPKGGGEG